MNHGHSSSIDAVVALERSGALLSEPSTMAALAAAIASVRSLHELESIVKRIHVWTEGELPLRGPALSAVIAAFLQGEDLPWQPVVDLHGNINGHYLKVARAVAEGELSPTRSAKAWLDCTGATHAALDCCLNDYWFVEQVSEVEWVNHLEFVLAIVDEVSRRGLPVRRLIERSFEDGNAFSSALLASALARVYEEAATPWPPELDGLLSDAVTSAKGAGPLCQALEYLPLPRLEAVLATFPALPFWDMCLTVPVVREMSEFVRLFPEHFEDVASCLRRGELAVVREVLLTLKREHELIVDGILNELGH